MSEDRFADVTTDELIEEIERRSKAFIVVTMPKAEQRNENQDNALISFGGGFYVALGLAQQVVNDLLTRNPRVCKPETETGASDESE